MANFGNRIIRAAKLDVALYEEVEADKSSLGQAMGVVVLSSIAAGIGSTSAGILGMLIGVVVALAGWYIWAYLTYFIGTKLLPEPQTKADHGELVAMIIAVRQALDYNSTLRAIGVCAIGWIVQIVLFVLLLSIFGGFSR
jgi:hypothetical protein